MRAGAPGLAAPDPLSYHGGNTETGVLPMRIRIAIAASLLLAFTLTPAISQIEPQPASPGNNHVYQPGELQWSPGPASLPAGAQFTVLAGDPTQAGQFTMRIRVRDGYRIPPHWHPATENVTVLSGTLHLGMGETFDKQKTQALEAGSFFSMEPGMRHYVYAGGDTVIQLHSLGPWQINYVNSADDPRQQAQR